MKYGWGVENEVKTIQGTLGWPPEAENDKYSEPLSRVSSLTNNPYTVEVQPVMTTQENQPNDKNAPGVKAEDMEFEEGDDGSVGTKVGTVGWPDAAENEQGTGPSGEKLNERGETSDQASQTQQPAQQPAQQQPAPTQTTTEK